MTESEARCAGVVLSRVSAARHNQRRSPKHAGGVPDDLIRRQCMTPLRRHDPRMGW